MIELMITLAVLAIVTSLALPSYRAIIEKRQVTSGAEQVGAFLSAVQIEAVKRNQQLAVSYARASVDSWCLGLTDDPAGSCDCTAEVGDGSECLVDDSLRVFRSSSLNYPGVMSAMNGDGAFVFDPVRGLMVDHADGASFELISDNGQYALNVEVTAAGRVKICSGDSSKQVPGYDEC